MSHAPLLDSSAGHRRLEAELAEKLRLQQLLADLSSRFVALPSSEVDAAIEETQELIVEALGLDRSTLWQLVDDGPGLMLTHCWQRPAWPPLPQHYGTAGQLPWAQEKTVAGEMIAFTSLDELPVEAARDVEMFRRYGPKSNVTIPLLANGKVFGALAFSTLGEERTWREDEITDLKLVAQIIGNVLSRQRAELREEQLRSELAHTMRIATLGELAAALAHELNQPLTAILTNAQAARRFLADGGISSGDLNAILSDIVRDDKRAGGVIQNLRAMVSKSPAVRQSCCLNELTREVLDLMHGELISERIEVRSALAPRLPRVEAARVELQQVIVNLLLNAVHALKGLPPDKRCIEIETKGDAESVFFSVRDCGHGIPPERLEKIFDAFFTTKEGGLGMGLSICRRIIETHAGRIRASNCTDAQGGALFSFSLPLVVTHRMDGVNAGRDS